MINMSKKDERKRHKRRRNDDKKRHKKQKDKDRKSHQSKRRRRCSDSDRDSDNGPVLDYARAMHVVRELLIDTPDLAKDLLELLQMIDEGEVAVISGIENRRIRSKLKELLPLLGLVKLKTPKGAYAKPRYVKHEEKESLITIFQRMLADDSKIAETDLTLLQTLDIYPNEDEVIVQKSCDRNLPIGPLLPPASARPRIHDVYDDDEEEVVGPALPGMKGFRLADKLVEAEITRQAEQLEKEQWKRARSGDKDDRSETLKNKPMVREAWMTTMPESFKLQDSLGPPKQPSGKIAAFRNKEPAAVDKTWFDSPEERERAQRAKLDTELLGYVREENASNGLAASSSMTAVTVQSTVDESILPIANPEADEKLRTQMEKLRESRGPSLLEQYQRKRAEQTNKSSQSNSGWNRDRDLTARRGMSKDDAERMISAAKQINSKFTAPTISRQFL